METNLKKKFLWIFGLSALTYFIQGFESLPGQALFVYMKKTLHLSPSAIMYIGAFTGLAWLVKPLIGFLIDNYLTKKQWYALALAASLAVTVMLGSAIYALPILIVALLISSTCTSFRDVAVDGIMVVEGQKNNLCGKIQSVQWIAITVASVLIGTIGGYIAQMNNYRIGFWLLLPVYILAVLFSFKYKEEKIVRPKCSLRDSLCQYKVIVKDKRYVFATLFFFFYCFSPSFGTPLAFIQRDLFHWSEIWIGILGTFIGLCEIVGAVLYYKFSSKIDIRKWLIGSVYFGATITLCYLYYTPVTAIVYGILFSISGMFLHLVMMDFVARISIKGLEATSFALLCSVHNLAGTASSLSGAWLLPKVGLHPLIIISSLTSFICLLWIRHLKIDNVIGNKQILSSEKCVC